MVPVQVPVLRDYWLVNFLHLAVNKSILYKIYFAVGAERCDGGHGGLNILPQKSWNVYGWKQRQKTARDEEIAAEEEQAVLNAEVQVQR